MNANTPSADHLFLGLKLFEWLTLCGVFAGPFFAILTTRWLEERRRTYDSRLQIIRAILTTRRFGGDGTYLAAVNLIEIEFNDCAAVMTARDAYLKMVFEKPAPEREEDHLQRTAVKQAELIHEMMKAVGLKTKIGSIMTDAYVSEGFVKRDAIYLDSLVAMRDVASALQESNRLMSGQVAEDPGKQH